MNLSQWRKWLSENGPILARLVVDSTWNDAPADGILSDYDAASADPDGGHAVVIVGYRPGAFIIRNSWGKAWGHKGFAYASDAYVQAAFTEAYGVTVTE